MGKLKDAMIALDKSGVLDDVDAGIDATTDANDGTRVIEERIAT